MKQHAPARRTFVASALGTGFALAVQPIAASAIDTDTDGLDAGEVAIAVKGGKLRGYRARPKGGTRAPVILVVHEIFGVHAHIQDLCRRLAKAGYFAVAPDLYGRQGDVSKMTDFEEIRSKVVSKVPDEQVMADLDATVAWAKRDGKADVTKLGITGFCWGGRITWLYAAHDRGKGAAGSLKGGVAWYGRLAGTADPLHPKHPLDLAAELKAPVLGLYGGADAGIPLSDVEAMNKALAAAGPSNANAGKSRITVFPDAPHAFNADYRPSYRPNAAADAWHRMLVFFEACGVK